MLSLINQFVYRPEFTYTPPGFSPADVGLAYEDAAIKTADGLTLSGWYLPAENASQALMYCHGNAGNIGDWIHAAPPFLQTGISLLLWDYRGYGRSQGRPSEEGLYLDGQAAWDWLKQRADRDGLPASMLGKSLGSAVTIHIAAQERPASLILDSAFTSMREVVSGALAGANQGWAAALEIPLLYESLSKINRVECPTLVLHGGRDTLVPIQQGRQLFQALPGRKAMVVIEHAEHNDISSFSDYHQAISSFLADPIAFTAV